MHRHDVRLLQRRRELDLTREALGAERGGQLRRQQLDHHVAAERFVARHEHARHAAAAKLTLERVGSAERGLQLSAEVVAHGSRSRR